MTARERTLEKNRMLGSSSIVRNLAFGEVDVDLDLGRFSVASRFQINNTNLFSPF